VCVSELGSAVAGDEIAVGSVADRCLLSGVIQTSDFKGVRTVFDPERSLDGINPTRRRNRLQDASRRRELNLIKLIVEVMCGLPVGSTPERPEGTEYSEVPPEETHR
jgi:hypothetical protein